MVEIGTAIMGPSGSGKSTPMHCVPGLDSLTSVRIADEFTEPTAESVIDGMKVFEG